MLSDLEPEIFNKDLHQNAKDLFRKSVNDFATRLLFEAKLLADDRNDDMVLCNHIKDALNIIKRDQTRKQFNEFGAAFGGVLFGAFFRGFTAEVSSSDPNTTSIIIYVSSGIIGLLIMAWAILGKGR